MLHVNQNNSPNQKPEFRLVDHVAVVDGMLNKTLKPDTMACPSHDRNTQANLNELLGTPHYKWLSHRLLEEVKRIYAPSPIQTVHAGDSHRGLDEFADQIDHLICEWNWSQSEECGLRLRFLAAWIAELRGLTEDAKHRYEGFLKEAESATAAYDRRRRKSHGRPDGKIRLDAHRALPLCPVEPQLCMMAYNNHSVITLLEEDARSGYSKAIQRIACLAVWHLLPGACLNLLNLIDLAWEDVCQGGPPGRLYKLEKAVARAFNELVADRYEKMGPQQRLRFSHGEAARKWKRALNATSLPTRKPFGTARANEGQRRAFIYALAETAQKIRTGKNVTSEVVLWPHRRRPLMKGPPDTSDVVDWLEERHAHYAEAISLLYPRDMIVRQPAIPMTQHSLAASP